MAQSYVEINHSNPVFVGHVCSKCGNPVVTCLFIKTHAVQYYSFFKEEACEKAQQSSKHAIDYEISRISSCKKNNDCLSTDRNSVSGMHYGSYCESKILGVSTPCPSCKHIESWQSPNGESNVDENYPTVFTNENDAVEWAQKLISQIKQNIDSETKACKNLEQTKKEIYSLLVEIKKTRSYLQNLPEAKEKNNLIHEKSLAIEQRNALGILEFGKKRLLNNRIKYLIREIKKLEETIQQKEEQPLKTIAENEIRCNRLQCIVFGYSDKILTKTNNYSCVYTIEPISPTAETNASIDTYDTLPLSNECIEDVSSEIIFCCKCGYKLIPNSIFCSACGYKIREDE